ncbi:hypothetical protein N0V82_002628 [Gnomoniopsis sp. IMI 355080]|nr:hypothetical protein N0V82_002628 [Gnomoniopsis sp. IMI 355080]
MQIPRQDGSPSPYAQVGGDPLNASPYPPYQQGPYGQPSPYGQPQYGQPQYGQQGYPEYAPPSQANYAPYSSPPPPAGYQYDHQSHGQYGSPPPNGQQPYQQQTGSYPPGPPSPYQYSGPADNNYQGQNVPPAEDRGVMGILAGGATGAWAGHKVNHGFLGALGGAFAGHKLQDAIGDHNKKKKHKKSHSSSSSSSSSSSCSSRHGSPPPQKHHAPPKYAGNFSGSATQITLDQDYDLIASCGKIDGSRKLSSISLNRCLTNSNGHFNWSHEGNFAASARNVRLVDGGKVLEAELKNISGHWVWDRIVLDEKIGNKNGELVMV